MYENSDHYRLWLWVSRVDHVVHAYRVLSFVRSEYNAGLHLINQQTKEFLKSFSFWPVPEARQGGHIYDIRSYQLKPGKWRQITDMPEFWPFVVNVNKRYEPNIGSQICLLIVNKYWNLMKYTKSKMK